MGLGLDGRDWWKAERQLFACFNASIGLPVSPRPSLIPSNIRAFRSQLAVFMKVAPFSVFEALPVGPLRRKHAVRVKCLEQAISYPARAIRRHFAGVAVANAANLKRYLCNLEVAHARSMNGWFSGRN